MKILTVNDSEYFYSGGYYTQNRWIDNDNVILIRSKSKTMGTRQNPFEDEVELVKFSVKSGDITPLCNDVYNFENSVVYDKYVYYFTGRKVKSIDLESGKINTLYENEYYKDFSYDGLKTCFGCPHITNDGKFLSLFIAAENKPSVFLRINTQTSEAKKLFEKSFEAPFSFANHGMICPANPDLIFFAHEGTTYYVSNRLWLFDANSGNMWNIAKQKLNDDGNLGDCYGHEMWAPDGKGLYFVKYPVSPTPPRGICYVDVQTGKTELLYSAYNYWHVGVSQDGKFLTSDTQTGKDYSEVVLIDREKNTETIIDYAKTNWTHPCHPHPQLSPDNSKLMYTALDENGRTCTKIALLR